MHNGCRAVPDACSCINVRWYYSWWHFFNLFHPHRWVYLKSPWSGFPVVCYSTNHHAGLYHFAGHISVSPSKWIVPLECQRHFFIVMLPVTGSVLCKEDSIKRLENLYFIKIIQLWVLLFSKGCEESRCYGLSVYVPPDLCVGILTSSTRVPGGKEFGEGLGHASGAFTSRVRVLIKGTPESGPAPLTMWGHSEKTAISEPRSRLSLNLPVPWSWTFSLRDCEK